MQPEFPGGEDSCESHEVDMDSVSSAKAELPDVTFVSSLFKVMGDGNRLSILYLLQQREWCVHDLAAILDTSVSNVSHQLRLLRAMRLVKSKKHGRRVVYSLDDEHVETLLRRLSSTRITCNDS